MEHGLVAVILRVTEHRSFLACRFRPVLVGQLQRLQLVPAVAGAGIAGRALPAEVGPRPTPR